MESFSLSPCNWEKTFQLQPAVTVKLKSMWVCCFSHAYLFIWVGRAEALRAGTDALESLEDWLYYCRKWNLSVMLAILNMQLFGWQISLVKTKPRKNISVLRKKLNFGKSLIFSNANMDLQHLLPFFQLS